MIDVEIGIDDEPLCYEAHETLEGVLLISASQCPVGGIDSLSGLVKVGIAEEELYSSGPDKGITLEVEKDVARRGHREAGQPLSRWRSQPLVLHSTRFSTRQLATCLFSHPLVALSRTTRGPPWPWQRNVRQGSKRGYTVLLGQIGRAHV